MATSDYVLMIVLMIAISLAFFVIADPESLQDVCVADLASDVKSNGFACKINISAADFFFAGLAKPGLTNNTFGATVTSASVQQIMGLNTLGVSMARIDYAPGGVKPPHIHPRATEIVFVLEGELDVGFITTENKLFSKNIKKGEIFTFPKGLIHFQINDGNVPAAVISSFNSQLPGTQRVANAVFVSSPTVEDIVLAKTFQVGTKEEEKIKSRLAYESNCYTNDSYLITPCYFSATSPPSSSFTSIIQTMIYLSLIIHYLLYNSFLLVLNKLLPTK